MTRTAGKDERKLGPIELVVLQGTPFCNLNCSYCCLSAESRRQKGRMPLDLIERVFAEIFSSRFIGDKLTVSWHAGEPLTLPVSYYEQAVERIQALKSRHGRDDLDLRFHIQTNGVLIDDAWCDFFRRHKEVFDIGVSCDGPQDIHDSHRLHWSGRPTFERTLHGMDLLTAYGLKYHLIAVVSQESLSQPERFIDFFYSRKDQIRGFHFNFLSEQNSPHPTLRYDQSDADSHYAFIRRILRKLRDTSDGGASFKVRNFAQFYAKIFAPENLRHGNTGRETSFPFRTLNIDVHGNVTTFHAGLYVDMLKDAYGDGFGLGIGNIRDQSIEEIAASDKLARMIDDFDASQRVCERECEYCNLCSGGYEVVKKKRFGTFEVSETPECRVHVKTLADALLDDLDEFLGREENKVATAAP
ncbi:MAG: radical SAM protein [Thiobacillaceae bacterium]